MQANALLGNLSFVFPAVLPALNRLSLWTRCPVLKSTIVRVMDVGRAFRFARKMPSMSSWTLEPGNRSLDHESPRKPLAHLANQKNSYHQQGVRELLLHSPYIRHPWRKQGIAPAFPAYTPSMAKTTSFSDSPCTPIAYASFSRPTAVSTSLSGLTLFGCARRKCPWGANLWMAVNLAYPVRQIALLFSSHDKLT
jgi:hypothetical protein